MLKKILIGTAALAMVTTPIAASAQPVYRGGAHFARGRDHDNTGAAVAAGLFGLVLGAAIASNSHPDYDRDYGYDQPYPTRCDWETRAYPGPWGSVSYQQVQVCR